MLKTYLMWCFATFVLVSDAIGRVYVEEFSYAPGQ